MSLCYQRLHPCLSPSFFWVQLKSSKEIVHSTSSFTEPFLIIIHWKLWKHFPARSLIWISPLFASSFCWFIQNRVKELEKPLIWLKQARKRKWVLQVVVIRAKSRKEQVPPQFSKRERELIIMMVICLKAESTSCLSSLRLFIQTLLPIKSQAVS